MKTIRKMLVIGVTVAGLGIAAGGVMAQSAPAAAPAATQDAKPRMTPEQHRARMQERIAKRTDRLKEKLKLTPEQEPAWNAWVSRMKPEAGPDKRQRMTRPEWEKLSAPERMERQLSHMKKMEEALAKRLEATKSFYAALTPEQQKVFNEATARAKSGHRHGRHHHGHGHHRHGGPGAAQKG